MGLRCVFSREPVAPPSGACDIVVEPGLNCHGYGSSVTVTASFGMVAAGEAIAQCLAPALPGAAPAVYNARLCGRVVSSVGRAADF
jgi:hypothetical protein